MGENLVYKTIFNHPENYVFFDVWNPNRFMGEIYQGDVKWTYENIFTRMYKKRNEDENNIFNNIITELQKKQEKHYTAEKNLAKQVGITKYPQLQNIKDLVQLWTRYFSFIMEDFGGGVEKFNSQAVFSTIISSSEFANLFRSKGGGYDSFYSRIFMGKEDKGEVEENLKALIKKSDDFGDFVLHKTSIAKDLREAMKEVLKDGVQVRFKYKKTFAAQEFLRLRNRITNETSDNKRKKKKEKQTLLKDFKNLLKEWGREQVEFLSDKSKWKDSIENLDYLSVKTNASMYWTIYIEQKTKGTFETIKEDNKAKDSVEIFYLAINDTLEKMENDKIQELTVGGGRKIRISKENLNNFYKEAKNYLIADKVAHAGILRDNLLKNKFNYDKGLTGILGEYLRLFQRNMSVTLTGQQLDESQNASSTGESFSDAYFEVNDLKMGLNIKHYVSAFNQDSVTIYEPKQDSSGVSLMNNAIYRYFEKEEVELLRFLDLNFNFYKTKLKGVIDENALKNLYYYSSLKNIDKFVRINSAIQDYSNYFFVINNMYFPTSYIYQIIIDSLNEELKNLNKSAFFQIHFYPGEPEIKKSIKTENLLETQAITNIANISQSSSNVSKIQFLGLKIKNINKLLI